MLASSRITRQLETIERNEKRHDGLGGRQEGFVAAKTILATAKAVLSAAKFAAIATISAAAKVVLAAGVNQHIT